MNLEKIILLGEKGRGGLPPPGGGWPGNERNKKMRKIRRMSVLGENGRGGLPPPAGGWPGNKKIRK